MNDLDFIIDHDVQWDDYIEEVEAFGYDDRDVNMLKRLRERLKNENLACV